MDEKEKAALAKGAVEKAVFEMLINDMISEEEMIEYLREFAHRLYLAPEHDYEVEE